MESGESAEHNITNKNRCTKFVKFTNLQRLKIENFKIRILFWTLWYKSFDEKICREYILNFLMTEKMGCF